MPDSSKHGPSVKDDDVYEAIREEGGSKEKAARIANAAANTSRKKVGRRGGNASDYEEWTKVELTRRAAEIGIDGRSSMTKQQLIDALRRH